MPFVPVYCPSCGVKCTADSDQPAAVCGSCGTPFSVTDAIVKTYVKLITKGGVTGAQPAAKSASDEFEIVAGKLIRYKGQAQDVMISGNVTIIGEKAFKGLDIRSVVIPDSVTKIGTFAFSDCTGLTSVTIPDSVTKIGNFAFSNCTGLTSVTIPDSVTTIGACAFSGCTGLTNVTIPNSVTIIGSDAFHNCTGLTSVTIPNSVTIIGSYAFDNCTGLTSVTIPDSVTEIGECAFSGCTGLTSVTIQNGVTKIGNRAFEKCYRLVNINVSETSISTRSFDGTPVLWMKLKVCRYCGGDFKGKAPRKCKLCGREKDY